MMGQININATDWAVYQGEQTFPISDPAILDFSLSAEGFVQVVGIRQDAVEVPIFSTAGGFHNKTLRLAGCTSIKFIPEKTTVDYGLLVSYKTSSATEVVNDFSPPEPEVRTNLMSQIRDRVRRELGIGLPEAFNDTGLPGYEVDDEAMFEEEEFAAARAAAHAASANPDGDTAGDTPPGESSASPSGDTPQADTASAGNPAS